MEVPETAVPGVATGGWLQTGLSMDSLVKMPKFSSIKNMFTGWHREKHALYR